MNEPKSRAAAVLVRDVRFGRWTEITRLSHPPPADACIGHRARGQGKSASRRDRDGELLMPESIRAESARLFIHARVWWWSPRAPDPIGGHAPARPPGFFTILGSVTLLFWCRPFRNVHVFVSNFYSLKNSQYSSQTPSVERLRFSADPLWVLSVFLHHKVCCYIIPYNILY